jgi:hypothetical protein
MTSKPLKHTPEGAESPARSPDAEPTGDEPVPDPGEATPAEIGGRDGPDPTRYGDWEKNGRCIDF